MAENNYGDNNKIEAQLTPLLGNSPAAKRTESFAPFLESIIENWGKKNLAKTTPKKKKTRKREVIKQLPACHLELQRKGAAKIARITNEYAENIWAPFVGFPVSGDLLSCWFACSFAPLWNPLAKNGEKGLLCTVLESIDEKWGKKGLAKTTPKR